MMELAHWLDLAQRQQYLCALKSPACDRAYLLQHFLECSRELDLPVYFWNEGYEELQWVNPQVQLRLEVASLQPPKPIALKQIVQLQTPGIFVLEGLLSTLTDSSPLKHEIVNAHFSLHHSSVHQFIVLVDDSFEIPLSLYALLPTLEHALPSRLQVQQQVQDFCCQHLANFDREDQRPLVQACIGLPRGEIDRLLHQWSGRSPREFTQAILDYKREKLRGRGINLQPQPDVPIAAGLELLDETFEKVRLLLQPEAEARQLRPPKAILLWGIPGSGKSLAAKLAAQRIGATLVSCDWNGLVGTTVRESMENLDHLIRFVSEIGTTLLFFDEFEKAFSGWRSDAEAGVLGKLAGRLLSWMQDHTEPVVMLATINHLDMLPAEMIRRFDYIHFFGMPHAGALYEVFQVHLARYFHYEFTQLQWRILLREYRGCPPDEVAKAIARVAHKLYFQEMRSDTFNPVLPTVRLEDLVAERRDFTPASAQQAVSDQIAAILNKARYAKPVSGKDTSIFASPPQALLGIDPTRQQSARNPHAPLLCRPHPAIEHL